MNRTNLLDDNVTQHRPTLILRFLASPASSTAPFWASVLSACLGAPKPSIFGVAFPPGEFLIYSQHCRRYSSLNPRGVLVLIESSRPFFWLVTVRNTYDGQPKQREIPSFLVHFQSHDSTRAENLLSGLVLAKHVPKHPLTASCQVTCERMAWINPNKWFDL
jgi:hypothetical protein